MTMFPIVLLSPAVASALTALLIGLLYPLRRAVKDDPTLDYRLPLLDDKKDLEYLIRDSKFSTFAFVLIGSFSIVTCVGLFNNYVYIDYGWLSPTIETQLQLRSPMFPAFLIALVGGLAFGITMRLEAKKIRHFEHLIRIREFKANKTAISLVQGIAARSHIDFQNALGDARKFKQRIDELEEIIELRQGSAAERSFLRIFARYCSQTDPLHQASQQLNVQRFQQAMAEQSHDLELQDLIHRLRFSKNTLIRRIIDTKAALPRSPS